jgi:hypothetical protein
MTENMLFIVSSAGLLIGLAGQVLVKLMARNRARYFASRGTHPAE